MKTTHAFSVPIGQVTIDQKICDQLKPLKGMDQYNTPVDQQNFTILNEHLDIKKAITDVFTEWVNTTYGYDHEWQMTTSWITSNQNGSPMQKHNHRNCMFSSVLYFDGWSDEFAALIFDNPFLNFFNQNFLLNPTNPNTFSSPAFGVDTYEGLMLFFPSYVVHGHSFYNAQTARKSLACNFFPKGKFGFADSSFDTAWIQ